MLKKKLDNYLGKYCKVTLFDSDNLIGTLYKSTDERFKLIPELFLSPNYYVIVDGNNYRSVLFRASHVIKIKEIE